MLKTNWLFLPVLVKNWGKINILFGNVEGKQFGAKGVSYFLFIPMLHIHITNKVEEKQKSPLEDWEI